MHTMKIGDRTIGYYDPEDAAPCRACHVQPEIKGSGSDGSRYLRCPECGIKTGTSTTGLDALIPKWNAVMDVAWPDSDPKRGL